MEREWARLTIIFVGRAFFAADVAVAAMPIRKGVSR